MKSGVNLGVPMLQGAAEMAEMEHVLNVYSSRVASKAVADFVGYCDVSDADSRVNKRLTPGLWLVRLPESFPGGAQLGTNH